MNQPSSRTSQAEGATSAVTDPGDPEAQTEAEAQREETVMPWVWGALGLVAIVGFVAWFVLWPALHQVRQPAAAAPLTQHD